MQKGFTTFLQLVDFVKKDVSGTSLQELIDRMSTNHTFFYREPQHFKFFSEIVLPEMKLMLERQRSNDLRLWCAAASTGEEPYSILMTMMDFFKNDYAKMNAGLLATDVSSRVIQLAQSGLYTQEQVENISPLQLKKYFHQTPEGKWAVNKELRDDITFRRFNLMNAQFPFKKPFHVIFCRNVMIYFDTPTRKELVRKLYNCTVPGGYLFIGHSESIRDSECPFEFVQPAVFRRRY